MLLDHLTGIINLLKFFENVSKLKMIKKFLNLIRRDIENQVDTYTIILAKSS